MNTLLVVDAVTLRALEDIPAPVRRLEVPVVEQLAQPRQEDGSRCSRRAETQNQIQEHACQQAVDRDLQRVLVEGGEYLQPLRAVVNLMEPTPEQRDFMTPAVPPVIDEGGSQVSEEGADCHPHLVRRPQAIFQHPRVQSQPRQQDDGRLRAVECGGTQPPRGDLRPRAGRRLFLDADHDHGYGQDN
jgi:hypothetical protein